MRAMLTGEYRDWAAEGLAERDWRTTYDAAKGWVSRGGGAWIPECWLVHAASGVLHRQPRTGVHALDLALGNWVSAEPDRSILLWARASIVWHWLDDPKTAEADFTAAGTASPAWLQPRLEHDVEACREAAALSRKRKAAVASAPGYATEPLAHGTVAPREATHEPGVEPELWDLAVPILTKEQVPPPM